jgi:hypothetical protein
VAKVNTVVGFDRKEIETILVEEAKKQARLGVAGDEKGGIGSSAITWDIQGPNKENSKDAVVGIEIAFVRTRG